jgi:hypothetical protein
MLYHTTPPIKHFDLRPLEGEPQVLGSDTRSCGNQAESKKERVYRWLPGSDLIDDTREPVADAVYQSIHQFKAEIFIGYNLSKL